ncbi:MAG TPA: serine hydrolase, partial [Bacillota bacterium]|nr:serine hydrolase [Bacillota bacterium]
TLLEYYQSAALYCYVINAKTGSVLYSKNADQKAYPASITKLMTACVMLKYCEGDEVFTAGDEVGMIGEGSSIAYIKKRHRLTVNMLVDAMLLPSGNDAAYVVAVNVARKVSGNSTLTNEEAVAYFTGLMNQEAAALGCTGTHFNNPDGYHDDNHYSTAADLALICKYARTFETICESVAKESVSVVYASGQTNTWYNTNYLLTHTTYSGDESKWYKSYVTGMKTGMTDEAGSCIAISAEKDGLSVIAIVLNCSSMTARYNEAFRLMEAIYGEDK